jgi:hypothetical protein
MCNPHHIVTNDETVYTVKRMHEIKLAHEGRFAGVISGLQGTVEDQTKYAVVYPPQSMAKYSEVLQISAVEALEHRDGYVILLDHLAKLPPDARSVLATMVERGVEGGLAAWSREGSLEVLLPELRRVLGIDDGQLRDELAILKKHDMADLDVEGSEESLGAAVALAFPSIKGVDDYAMQWIKAVADASGVPVTRAIVGLDFRLLDG